MINKIIKLANKYDQLGENIKADRLDLFLTKCAQEEKEPTMEDLMKEEEWLQTEKIDDDQDILEGLEGDDKMAAEEYLAGKDPQEIKEMIESLRNSQEVESREDLKQESILEELSNSFSQARSNEEGMPELLPHQRSIMPEASFISDLTKLSEMLDKNKLFKAADYFDSLLSKIASGIPDDPDEDDKFLEEMDSDFRDSHEDTEELEEPSTEELKSMEAEMDDFLYKALDFMRLLSEGKVATLEEAQEEAKAFLMEFDKEFDVLESPELEVPELLPDNVLEFRGK